MVTLSKAMSAGAASGYYQKDSYYAQEGQGTWSGNGAKLLGLTGEIDELSWAAARHGIDPAKITPEIAKQLDTFSKEEGRIRAAIAKDGNIPEIKQKIDAFNTEKETFNKSIGDAKLVADNLDADGILTHRAGLDITVSAPKSLSILALIGGDERLKEALVEANKEVMEYAEKNFAQGRVWNSDLKMQERIDTGNLLIAQYGHSTSRSVAGQTPDPQLHIHNFVSNITLAEQKYRAIEPSELYKHQKMLGQISQNAMAEKVQKLGYEVEWERQKNGNYTFEIKGVDKTLIQNFSKRTEIIEKAIEKAELESRRTLTAAEKDVITKDTKSSKEKQNIDSLKQKWEHQTKELGYTKDDIIGNAKHQNQDKRLADSTDKAVDIASKNLENSHSVFDKHQIIHESAKASQGQFDLKDIESAIENSSTLKRLNDKFYTTQTILNAEKSIIDIVTKGKNSASPLLEKEQFEKNTADSDSYHGLTNDQQKALRFIATTTDSLVAVQGDAGSGKTTMFKELGHMLSEAKNILNNNTDIVALAPTGKASSVMFKEAGLESQTIDSFLLKPASQNNGGQKNIIYIVDESSMIPTLKLEALLSKAEQENARVVLTGDIKQLPPIEQGSMFAKLQKDEIISSIEMTQVLRQKTELTQGYAQNFKSGNIEIAFEHLASNDRLIEIADKSQLSNAIIANAVNDIKEFGIESVAVLSNSNQMKSYLNQGIRNELIADGFLNIEKTLSINALEAKQLDSFDAKLASNYEAGDVMYAYKMQGDIKNGQAILVLDTNSETNDILVSYQNRIGDLKEKWIDAEQAADAYNAYSSKEKIFAVGDKVTFNRNTGELKNGDHGIITDIDHKENTITVNKDGEELTINADEYKNIDYGYATTTHKAQGMTAEHVHIYAEADHMQNFNSGYVEATRAKEDIHVYVDDKNTVVENYKELTEKINALDISQSLPELSEHGDIRKDEISAYQDKKLEVARFEESLSNDLKHSQSDDNHNEPDRNKEDSEEEFEV